LQNRFKFKTKELKKKYCKTAVIKFLKRI